jgi:hypothetical protein
MHVAMMTGRAGVARLDSKSGGRGGRAGDIYSLFLAAKGVPGEELRVSAASM